MFSRSPSPLCSSFFSLGLLRFFLAPRYKIYIKLRSVLRARDINSCGDARDLQFYVSPKAPSFNLGRKLKTAITLMNSSSANLPNDAFYSPQNLNHFLLSSRSPARAPCDARTFVLYHLIFNQNDFLSHTIEFTLSVSL